MRRRAAVDWMLDWSHRHHAPLSVPARAELLAALERTPRSPPTEMARWEYEQEEALRRREDALDAVAICGLGIVLASALALGYVLGGVLLEWIGR